MKPKRVRNGSKKTTAGSGYKVAFTTEEINALATILRANKTMRGRREYALMRLGVDVMLRSVDLLAITYGDVMRDGRAVTEFRIVQQKTGIPVTCYLNDAAREALEAYVNGMSAVYWEDPERLLFPFKQRWYRVIAKNWAKKLHLNPTRYSTHSIRRTKARAIYDATGNMKSVQLLLGHTSLRNTERYLGVEQSDAEAIARKITL